MLQLSGSMDDYSLITNDYLLVTTYHLLPTTHYLLLCSLLATYYLLLTICYAGPRAVWPLALLAQHGSRTPSGVRKCGTGAGSARTRVG